MADADQAMCETMFCTQCRIGFNSGGRPIYAPLEPKWATKKLRTWCCTNCGASYGSSPHRDLRDLSHDVQERTAADFADPATCTQVVLGDFGTSQEPFVFYCHSETSADWLAKLIEEKTSLEAKVLVRK